MGYFKDTLKGVSWMTILRVCMRGLAVIKIAILARILLPSQFGNYTIALLVLGFLEVLTETGINVFLIQEKDNAKKYLDSAWVVSIVRGVLVSLMILATSPLVIKFFNVPDAESLLLIVAAVAFARGLINPMEVTYQKNLQFKKEFFFRGSLYFIDAVTAIVLGIITHSESSMLFSMLAAACVEVILSFVLFKDRPKLSFQKARVAEVVKNGRWVTGAGIFSYIFQNIDDIVVGKILGTTNLGFYQQAYSISTLPVTEVGNIFNKVTFPVYVAIGEDKKRLRKAFLKTLGVITLLVIPFALLIFLFSETVILIFLGKNWLPIEPILKILAIFGVLKSISNFSHSLFYSLKLQKYVMYSELAGIIGMGIVLYPLTVRYGTSGAACSTIFAFAFSFPVVVYGLKKIFK